MRTSPLSLLTLTVALAATAAPAAEAPTGETRPIRTRVEVRRADAPPDLEAFAAAMERGEDPAPGMARVEGFITRYPFDGQPATERTVVYLAFDDAHLYAVWMCFDREPHLVRAPNRRRDNIPDEDDSVALQLDPFRDQQHLQGFQTSVNGAINDGTYTEGQGWDLSNDSDWSRAGRMTDNGYVIVMNIPFRALRFPPGEVQDWGFLMFRGIGRKNESDFFPWFSTSIGSRMLQTGTLAGLEVRPERVRWQLTPFVTAADERSRDPSTGAWREDSGVEAGIDGKLVWEDRLVWDFTVNPDFSQVESDEPQVLSNQRFEVFFPEKRPFFIENAGYFTTPLDLMFTRRIVDPSVGLRLTGQSGRWAVSGLAIEDDHPLEALATPGAGGATLVYGGLRRNGEGDSSLGGALMQRRGPLTTTTLASFDGRQRLDPNWITTFQLAASRETPDDGTTGERAEGDALLLGIDGSGQLWSYGLELKRIDDGFSAPVGFVPRLGIQQLTQSASRRFETRQPWLLGVGPYAETRWTWDLDGKRLDQALRLRIDAELPRATWVYLYLDDVRERITPDDFAALAADADFAQQRVGVSWRSAFSSRWLLTGEAHWGDYVNYEPPVGDAPTLGRGRSVQASATWFPATVLEIGGTWLETTHETRDGRPAFLTRIARLKSVYHFDHAWQLRLIVDGAETRSDQGQTSLWTQRSLSGDLLLQWLPSPGDAFYLGASNRRQNRTVHFAQFGLDQAGVPEPAAAGVFVKYSRRFDL